MGDNKWNQPDAPPPPLFTGKKERDLVKQVNDEVIERVIGQTTNLGVDRLPKITVHFHKRRLTEDQNLFVREGDFVLYGETFYEIATLNEPKQLFGQRENMVEITAECIKAREGLFNG